MPDSEPDTKNYTRSQQLFRAAPEEYQKLIQDILKEEREVMHLLRRPEIHLKIVQLVRRHIS